ncbi:MAG: ATP-binding protein [Lachnospiraceae bacterium]|nr:ATP-binding protein [Lachnospiraceae bacterium]MBR6151433.1 ATP-binding protein [Lachnospiraceae bacterium]
MPTSISLEKLINGEMIALGCLEITAIPHASIIEDRQNSLSDIVEVYKSETVALLNEVYQSYKSLSSLSGYSKDTSFELLWTTHEVKNQPFKAEIKLHIIVRVIDASDSLAKEAVLNILRLFKSTLSIQKYDFREINYEELSKQIASVEDTSVKAIMKEEKVESLQNQLLPYCYAYDRIPISSNDLSRIVNVLIDYPNCAISFQLIPTVIGNEEAVEIDRVSQILETLSKGVMNQGIGNISFTLAENHAKTYRYYSEHKTSSLFIYNILVYGNETATSNISGRVFGQLSTGKDSTASLKLVDLDAGEINKDTNFYPLPWAVNEILINKGRNYQIWSSGQFSQAYYRLPLILTAEEAAEFFRLPIGNDRITAGLPINESGKGTKTYTSNIINAGDIEVGKLRSSTNGDTIGFSLKDLAKHMLIVGTPGSGKTTFSVSLLDRLWKEHHIPFLVIEPAKNEYRALVQSIPELQVFTPGKNFISPFVFNPFVPPKNVKLETYKSTLKTAFSAAVSMSTPLDKIFEETINNCYSDFRWLDTYTIDDKGQIFNISDFIKCFQNTFEEIGYTGDAKNIGRAGVVRLNSLSNLFDNYFSIPIQDLLEKPTIIELAAIENSDQKALIISLLLLSILAYVNSNYVGEGGLKNVILLEEAHVLLDAESNASQGDANPSAIAQGLVKRMLAEIRSYGVGIVIADQSPRKVSTDVVALTDMKMVFRLVETMDKQIVADSMNMSEAQTQRMSRLKPGEAYLFFNRLDEPEEVITPDYRLENNISITLSDDGIRELSTYWNDKQEHLRPYPECAKTKYCSHSCDYARRILAREIARRIFVKNFKAGMSDFEAVKKVFGQITNLVKAELNDEPFSKELLSCVKVHLWRRIRYGTKIPVRDIHIVNSLEKP